MKKILLAVLSLSAASLNAQNCSPNGITTNPAAPVNTQNPAKKNTFNYTATQFNLNEQSKGIYFLSLKTNGTKITRKIIIIK